MPPQLPPPYVSLVKNAIKKAAAALAIPSGGGSRDGDRSPLIPDEFRIQVGEERFNGNPIESVGYGYVHGMTQCLCSSDFRLRGKILAILNVMFFGIIFCYFMSYCYPKNSPARVEELPPYCKDCHSSLRGAEANVLNIPNNLPVIVVGAGLSGEKRRSCSLCLEGCDSNSKVAEMILAYMNSSGDTPCCFRQSDPGLSAARQLLNLHRDIIVLEARARVGGKIYSQEVCRPDRTFSLG